MLGVKKQARILPSQHTLLFTASVQKRFSTIHTTRGSHAPPGGVDISLQVALCDRTLVVTAELKVSGPETLLDVNFC